MTRSLVRFFWVVSPHPAYVPAGFAALVAIGAWSLWLNPGDTEAPLAPVLLFQAFAASTGFVAPASRGHYDAVLAGPGRRTRIALAHWLVSASPGLSAWLALALAEIAISAGRHADAFAPRALTALLLVSSIAWASTLALPRLSGGVAWTLLLIVLAATREDAIAAARTLVAAPAACTPGVFESVAAFTVCPLLLLTHAHAARSLAVLVAECGIALAVAAGGIAFIVRREYPLVQRL